MTPDIPLANLTVAQIVTWLIGTGVIVAALRWLTPIVSGLHAMAEDWRGAPARPGVPARPGIMERVDCIDRRLTKIEEDAASAAFHSKSNHGSSSHDVVMRELRATRALIEKMLREKEGEEEE